MNWIMVSEARSAWICGAGRAFKTQFIDFGIGMITSQKEGSAPYSVLESAFGRELNNYRKSKQYNNDLYFRERTKVQLITVLVSFLFILVLLIFWKHGKAEKNKWVMLSLALLLFLLLNAAVCGILSSPVDRYQARVIWLVPLLALVIGFIRLGESENKFIKKLFENNR
jgi:4-amino-4-deoxy-L-arabinose transferase-like glycosyltransferase